MHIYTSALQFLSNALCCEISNVIDSLCTIRSQVVLFACQLNNAEYLEKEGSDKNSVKEVTLSF